MSPHHILLYRSLADCGSWKHCWCNLVWPGVIVIIPFLPVRLCTPVWAWLLQVICSFTHHPAVFRPN